MGQLHLAEVIALIDSTFYSPSINTVGGRTPKSLFSIDVLITLFLHREITSF